jgi:hypothetical protein
MQFLLLFLAISCYLNLENNNYIIRITKEVIANHIFGLSIYYVRLRREWSKGSKLIFLKKIDITDEDTFIGIGTIEKTFEPSELDFVERKKCIENNYYKKIVFGKLVKFVPELPIKHTQIFSLKQRAPLLHGMQISDSEILNIESLVSIMIMT